jgi:hypothetical protein
MLHNRPVGAHEALSLSKTVNGLMSTDMRRGEAMAGGIRSAWYKSALSSPDCF